MKAGFKYGGFHLKRAVPYAVSAVTESGEEVGLAFERIVNDRPGIMKASVKIFREPVNQMIFNPHFGFGSNGRCTLIPVVQIIEQIL